jgi:hypothetical protein
MHRERIRSNRQWKGKPRYDTVFVNVGDDDNGSEDGEPTMHGMLIARVLLFFSFNDPVLQKEIPCALVNWFVPLSAERDKTTGMWECRMETNGARPVLEVIHLDSIVRGVHLLPHFGCGFLPEAFDYTVALDSFRTYFVNHFVDYHVHELLQDW